MFPTEAESACIMGRIGIFSELVDVPAGNTLDTPYRVGVADAVRGGGKESGDAATSGYLLGLTVSSKILV